jgi:hypothetical protein
MRKRARCGNDLCYAVKTHHQLAQRCRHVEQHPRAARRNKGRITPKLNYIAKSLFAVQQNCFSFNIRLAKSQRLLESSLL